MKGTPHISSIRLSWIDMKDKPHYLRNATVRRCKNLLNKKTIRVVSFCVFYTDGGTNEGEYTDMKEAKKALEAFVE